MYTPRKSASSKDLTQENDVPCQKSIDIALINRQLAEAAQSRTAQNHRAVAGGKNLGVATGPEMTAWNPRHEKNLAKRLREVQGAIDQLNAVKPDPEKYVQVCTIMNEISDAIDDWFKPWRSGGR